MHNGQAVETVSTKDCLVDFINYLASKESPICVGHNIRSFDCPILVHHLLACELFDQFVDSVHGFLDTLLLYKHLLPQRKSFRQEQLFKDIVGGQYEAHNAIADVAALRGLVEIADVSLESMESFTFCVGAVKHMMMFNAQKSKNYQTLKELVSSGLLTKCMGEKIAGSGLQLSHLKTVFSRDGRVGIETLFGEKVDGKVRVTRTKRIIDNVCSFLGN